MLPAVSPPVAATAPQGTSPLLTPLIPLYVRPKEHGLGALAMPAIPGSPALLLATSNDATPMPQPNRRARVGTLENGGGAGGKGEGRDRDRDSKEPADYFGARARQVSIQSGTAPSQPDDFSGWSGPGSAAQTPSTPTGLMGRLKSFGKLKRTADVAAPMLPTTVELPVVEVRGPTRVFHFV
jgi:WD repeat-containing protein 48